MINRFIVNLLFIILSCLVKILGKEKVYKIMFDFIVYFDRSIL